jgi:hypothetical protein
MIPKNLAKELAELDPDGTYLLCFYRNNALAHEKRFKPGSDYSFIVGWATKHYEEGFGFTLDKETAAVNTNIAKVLRADGEVK